MWMSDQGQGFSTNLNFFLHLPQYMFQVLNLSIDTWKYVCSADTVIQNV